MVVSTEHSLVYLVQLIRLTRWVILEHAIQWQLEFRLDFDMSDGRLEQLLKFRRIRYIRILLIFVCLLALALTFLLVAS